MFCPKCGRELTAEPGGPLTCTAGEMELSAWMERRLTQYFLEDGSARSAPFSFRVGGEWFCPRCGVSTTESTPGDVRCPSCGRSLVEFIHGLVELHPHRQPDGRWR